ncbi:MAG: M24 family metallopeptidase [Hyphomicrobiaceae bacterium]
MSTVDGRLADAVAALEREGLWGLVAFCDGQNSFLEANAAFVLSGVRPIGESAVVVEKSGRSMLIITPAWDVARASAISRTTETIGVDDLGKGLADAFRKSDLRNQSLKIVGLSRQRRVLADGFRRMTEAKLINDDAFIARLARIRSAEELECSKKAVEIAEQGYSRLLEVARPGVREFEVAAEIYTHMKSLGAEDNFLLMSASQHNLAVRAAGQRVLERGDIILGEVTPCYRGQFVQICRTAIIGDPGPEHQAKYDILAQSMQCGLKAARPGATVAEVTEAMNEPLREAGYADYCRPPYMRVRGHGLGITSSMPGDIAADNKTVLEEGMIFVMHPNQYIPETGYLMYGDTVVVGPDGARSLANIPSRFDTIEA